MISRKNFRYLSIFGILISLVLLYIVLRRVDWAIFINALKGIQLQWIPIATLFIILGVAVRSFRWNTISAHSIAEYRYFWKSMNLGYCANMIYPARAGEIVRMIAIHRYVDMPQGKAISSVLVDRIADGLILGVFILLLIALPDVRYSWGIAFIVFVLFFIIVTLLLIAFILWGDRIYGKFSYFLMKGPERLAGQLDTWYNEAFDGMQMLKDKNRLFFILILSIAAFLIDALSMYCLIISFQWELPAIASIYLAIFIQAGTILPSAPGYVGIYQAACVLALGIFGIDNSAAFAFSLVLQVLVFCIFLIAGGIIVFRDGFSLYKINNDASPITKGE